MTEAPATFQSAPWAILNHIAECFAAMDGSLNLLAVNREFEDQSGRIGSAITGQNWEECFPSAHPLVLEHLRLSLRTGEAAEFETEQLFAPGRRFRARTFAYPGGVGLLAANRSASQELVALEEQARSLRMALGVLPSHAVAQLDVRGAFVTASDVWEQMTGFNQAALVGSRLSDIVRPANRMTVRRFVDECFEHRRASTIDVSLLHTDMQEISVRLALAPVMTEAAVAVATLIAVRICQVED